MTTAPDADLEERGVDESAADALRRDREFARLVGTAMLAWALVWLVIIAALFLFGGTLAEVVV